MIFNLVVQHQQDNFPGLKIRIFLIIFDVTK